MSQDPLAALEEVVRTERRRVLATLVRTLGDLQLAEDAVQEATVAALRTWPERGVPADPRAWLTVTARHRALDVLRRESRRDGKEAAVEWTGAQEPERDQDVPDDLLRLLFTCCHPALSVESQVALALRTLIGLSVEEIAEVLLVEPSAMAKRLVRVRQKIARAGIPYRVPPAADLPARLTAVLAVVHLVYTAGHGPRTGPSPVRVDLCEQGVRLARLVVELMPAEAEATALLALLLLTDARRPARTDDSGAVVLLPEQDRRRWDQHLLREGADVLADAGRLRTGPPGDYLLQARLAACHSLVASYALTDWRTVVGLYDQLLVRRPSPVLRLNRAVALGERDGAQAMLAELDGTPLQRSHLWHAARAEALHRLGQRQAAADALDQALALVPGEADRRLLELRRQSR